MDEKNPIGNLKEREITEEMQTSYLDYAMSVIVSRALPDVRDGLKPVHRRVLFAMHEMGLGPGSRYRKSAAVVGEVLGKYHPHGDIAVYDSMVRLAQDFSMRYPLVDGQGNFGSVDGDSAAAMRYTEAKMTKMAEAILADIEKETVPWMDNYDGTRKEPKVLPAAVPNLLLNGTMGIAVGMATNIPPHNLGEVVDALIYIIDHKKATTEDLFQFVHGPDFPTGGTMYGRRAIIEAYGQGRGPIIVRGTAEAHDEGEKRGIKGPYIEITELPYQVNKATFIEKIAELVTTDKLEGIKDVRDESDKDGMSVIIELKKEGQPQKVLNILYKFSELQRTFHLNMLALVGGLQPQVLSLKEVLEYYLAHKREVVKKRAEFDLARAKERAHILEGLKKALDHIDAIIKTIRASSDREDAKVNLIKKFQFTEAQAVAILEMKLSSLANLERQKVLDELKEKKTLIAELTMLLKDEKRMNAEIKKELLAVKAKFGDARRTKLHIPALGEISEEDLIPKEETIVSITEGGYIKRVPPSVYKVQHRGGKGIIGMETKGEDVVKHLLYASTHDRLLFFTTKGRVFQTLAYEIPKSTRTGRGKALVNFLELASDEQVTAVVPLDKAVAERKFLVMSTRNGIIKKTSIEDFQAVRRSGLIAIHLKKDDTLVHVDTSTGKDEVLLVTKKGQSIRFKETDSRPMGRSAGGVKGVAIKSGDEVVGMDVLTAQDVKKSDLLVITENGYGKRTSVVQHKVQRRGGSGIKAANINAKTGNIVAAHFLAGTEEELIIVSKKAQVIRIELSGVPRLGRATQGVRVMKLKSGDAVASATIV